MKRSQFSVLAVAFVPAFFAVACAGSTPPAANPGQGADSTATTTDETTTTTEPARDPRIRHTQLATNRSGTGPRARIKLKSDKLPKTDDQDPTDSGEIPQGKPEISGIYPNSASAGSVVEIFGTNFAQNAADNLITVGGVNWEVRGILPGKLVAIVPNGAKNGVVEIKAGKQKVRTTQQFRAQETDAAFGRAAVDLHGLLGYVYPLSTAPTQMPDFASLGQAQAVIAASTLDIANTSVGRGVSTSKGNLTQNFAVRYLGSFNVENEAEYTLCLESDDGAVLKLEGQVILDNGGVHTSKKVCEFVYLEAGEYGLEIDYFQAADSQVALRFLLEDGNGASQPVPMQMLYRPENPATASAQ